MSSPVSLPVTVAVATAVAVAIVVLTWLRLRGSGGPAVGRRMRAVHLGCGLVAAVVWTTFLVAPADTVIGSATTGIIGLGFWWIVAAVGLAMLPRWLPTRGKRAARHEGRRGVGLGLSLLAHLAMVAVVALFTYAYVTAAV